MRRLSPPGRDDDRGAIAVLVAVLLSTGVLLGLGALVIDVGTLSVQRERLQSDADSAAWAVAADCALGNFAADEGKACADPDSGAAGYSNSAARAMICPPNCGGADGLPNCPAVSTAGADGVATVEISTRNADGSTVLPPVFASAVDPDYHGTTVKACSQVAWRPATEGVVSGLAIGSCKFAPLVRRQDAATATPVVLDSAQSCGSPAAPEFAWLDGPDCRAEATVGETVATTTDGTDCLPTVSDARDREVPLLVPLVEGSRVVALSGFLVTGILVHEPGNYGELAPPGCPASDVGDPARTCMTGYFTRVVVPASSAASGTSDDFGAAALSRVS